MSEKMKIVSLFSGIGGFEEGLKASKINGEVVFSSEIDVHARTSYVANFGSDNLFGDITQIDEKDVPEHNLLLAGFPCQSFSIAGMRKGFDDTRGTLFFDVARILKEKQPRFVLLENVKNLVSHDKSNTIQKILWTLSDLGYTVDFSVLNSYEAGVPQNRDRTYICAILGQNVEKYDEDRRSLKVTKIKKELNDSDFRSFNLFNNVSFNSKMRFIENILEKNVDDNYFLDTDEISSFLSETDIPVIKKKESKIIKVLDLPREVHNDLERQRRVYSVKGISPTVLARADSTKILVNSETGLKIRKVTPVENFYIQGFSKKFVKNICETGMSATQMYKQSGNAVSPPVITGILNYLYDTYIGER